MNANEYGVGFRFGCGFDISGFTILTLDFVKPDGTALQVTDPEVAVGGVDVVTPAGTFLANQYATYTFANGDIDQEGTYTCRLTYDDGTRHLISNEGSFLVNP